MTDAGIPFGRQTILGIHGKDGCSMKAMNLAVMLKRSTAQMFL